MTTELTFRVIFISCWVVFIGTIAWARLRGRVQFGSSTVRRFTRKRLLAGALFAPWFYAGIILYAVWPRAIAFLSIPLPMWFRFAMVALLAPSGPLIIWGFVTLGKNWIHALDAETFRQRTDQVLVIHGPFRYVRNPMYLGGCVFFIAIGLVAANWLLLVPGLVACVIILVQIPNEEAMLLERFGDQYRAYCKRTPRLIPWFRPRT